jgi:hypothetical protein
MSTINRASVGGSSEDSSLEPDESTAPIPCQLSPTAIVACLDHIEWIGSREHFRWTRGALLWMRRAMVFGSEEADEWASGFAWSERRGAEAVSREARKVLK